MWATILGLVLSTAFQGALCDFRPFHNDVEYMQGKWGNYTRQRFLSDDKVLAPVANVMVPAQDGVSPSKHLLWVPHTPILPLVHPVILDTKTLSVVWYGDHHAKLGAATGTCNGSDYIFYWSRTGQLVSEGRFFFVRTCSSCISNRLELI